MLIHTHATYPLLTSQLSRTLARLHRRRRREMHPTSPRHLITIRGHPRLEKENAHPDLTHASRKSTEFQFRTPKIFQSVFLQRFSVNLSSVVLVGHPIQQIVDVPVFTVWCSSTGARSPRVRMVK